MLELAKFLFVILCLYISNKLIISECLLLLAFLTALCCFLKLNPVIFLFKIKYFILSIFIIYPLSIPGEIIFNISMLSFTDEGFYSAARQSIKLLNLFFIAKIYVNTTSNISIINSVMYFIYPLILFKINVNRIHKIMILTLGYFELLSKENISFKKPLKSLKLLLTNNKKININIASLVINPAGYLLITFYFVLVFFI